MTDLIVPDIDETAIDQYEATAAELIDSAQQVLPALNSIGDSLAHVLSIVEAHDLDEAQNAILTAWEGANRLYQHIGQMDIAIAGGATAVATLRTKLETALAELESIAESIRSGNTLDERLSGIVEAIEEEIAEWAEAEGLDTAREHIENDIGSVARYYGGDSVDTHQLILILRGDMEPSDEQALLFSQFLQSVQKGAE